MNHLIQSGLVSISPVSVDIKITRQLTTLASYNIMVIKRRKNLPEPHVGATKENSRIKRNIPMTKPVIKPQKAPCTSNDTALNYNFPFSRFISPLF